MAKSDIWMPLYIGDYLADTQLLTTEQHGAYLLLIMAYWKNGGAIPNDDAVLAKVCGLSLRRFKSQKKTLLNFFKVSENELLMPRIDEEIKKAEKAHKAAKARGAAGAAARWGDTSSNAQSIDEAMLEQCQSQSQPQSPDKIKSTLPRSEFREELIDSTTGEVTYIGGES